MNEKQFKLFISKIFFSCKTKEQILITERWAKGVTISCKDNGTIFYDMNIKFWIQHRATEQLEYVEKYNESIQ